MKRSNVYRNAVLFLVAPLMFLPMATTESYAIPTLFLSADAGVTQQEVTLTQFTTGCPTGFTCYGMATGSYLNGLITVASTGTTNPYVKVGDTATLDTLAVTSMAITSTSTGTVDLIITANNTFVNQPPTTFQEGLSLVGSAQAPAGENLGGDIITMSGYARFTDSGEIVPPFATTTVNLAAVAATNFGPVPIRTGNLSCAACTGHALTEQLNIHIVGQDTIRSLNSPTVGSGTEAALIAYFDADRAAELAVPEPGSLLLLGLGGLGLLVYGLFRKREEVALA